MNSEFASGFLVGGLVINVIFIISFLLTKH